jgi:hypothetical protein
MTGLGHSGCAGPSAAPQINLNKRTLTPRSAPLSFVQKLRLLAGFPEPTYSKGYALQQLGSKRTPKHHWPLRARSRGGGFAERGRR